MTIGAIETYFRGHLFRSRLEARWAVFFDSLGIQWKYEHEGYEVNGERYLPDFWLPDLKAWAEVKGDPDGLRSDFTRMSAMLGIRSPLPGFFDGETSLIVLGDVPEVSYGVTVLHPVFTWLQTRSWGYFAPLKAGGYKLLVDEHQSHALLRLLGKHCEGLSDPHSNSWDPAAWVLDTRVSFTPVLDAYRAARKARFEHGAGGQ